MAVRQLPTFTIFANGQKLTDYVGTSVSEVARLLRKHKPAPPPAGPLARVLGSLVRLTILAGVACAGEGAGAHTHARARAHTHTRAHAQVRTIGSPCAYTHTHTHTHTRTRT